MNYRTIASDASSQMIIKKSRFICQSKRVNSEEEARTFIAQIKKDHYKANHSCSAMIIGQLSEVKRSSDDGEPSGTAGVPMLTVLEKQGVTNLVVVVTRYFGGIKLGAGGLIRAYGGAVAQHLDQVGLVQVKEQTGLELTLSYSQYQTLTSFLQKKGLKEEDSQFGADVKILIYLDHEQVQPTLESLTDYYQGKLDYAIGPKKVVEVPILSWLSVFLGVDEIKN